jgi:uncharacterized repeat protein (TIGR04138 family)
MKKINVQDALDQILRKDPRYDRDAYTFVREALDHTLKRLKKPDREQVIRQARETGDESKRRASHVTGQELLEGARDLALKQFGPLGRTVLEHWGVTRCEDFGEIVFNMVEAGVLGKTDRDTKADFAGGYDFEEAFTKPFLPPVNSRANSTADYADGRR